jgi:poly-gamma-glutamate synthesis protein (capsule biosynthesis protein)
MPAVIFLLLSVATLSAPSAGTAAGSRLPAVTLAAIFGPKPSLAHLDQRRLITLAATGDVIPGRTSNYLMVQSGDFIAPFVPTAPFLRKADIALINLESPLLAGCQPTVYGMAFCGDPRFVQGLTYAGIDIANLSNNHLGNYGWDGVYETERHLAAAGIAYCGMGVVAHLRVKGVPFAFLGYNGVGIDFDRAQIAREIRAEHRAGNVVVVSLHWGKEYVRIPATAPGIANDDPRQIGRLAIDSGADLVVGNHPHWVQGVEIYHGKLITYAHGNFIFDQDWSVETQQGVIGRYVFYGHTLVQARYFPVVIAGQLQPRWATPAVGQSILAAMRDASLQMAGRSRL